MIPNNLNNYWKGYFQESYSVRLLILFSITMNGVRDWMMKLIA